MINLVKNISGDIIYEDSSGLIHFLPQSKKSSIKIPHGINIINFPDTNIKEMYLSDSVTKVSCYIDVKLHNIPKGCEINYYCYYR